MDYSIADRFVEVFGTQSAFKEAGLKFESTLSDAEHLAIKIRAGIAEITPESSEKYTPHMLNLDIPASWQGKVVWDALTENY